jgi:hypothetical protein
MRDLRAWLKAEAGDANSSERDQTAVERLEPRARYRVIGKRYGEPTPLRRRNARVTRQVCSFRKTKPGGFRRSGERERDGRLNENLQRSLGCERDRVGQDQALRESVVEYVLTGERKENSVETEPRARR